MRMVDVIHRKRQGEILTEAEITYFIQGYTNGSIPDYQVAALLMAIYFKGMNEQEIADLTLAMAASGDQIDLSQVSGIKVDKHSTGGVGDKISLIVAPLVASVGVPVAKMSGRGLGHTGGTIDKLESIPGFQVELSQERFIENVNLYQMAIAGQSGNLAPADKKLYALRDVTDTVDSIPLIASSIMSKKIASGADCIVLDVKVGSGAFMKSIEDARVLAQTMVEIGKRLNRKTIAVISDMNQPLGQEVGNANEIVEAIQVLKGNGPEDLTLISLTLAAHMTVLGGIYPDFKQAFQALREVIDTGQAIQKLKEFVKAQGGDESVIDEPAKFPQSQYHCEVTSSRQGFVESMDAELIGIAAMKLGAGRQKKEDTIDHAAGVTLLKKTGDEVKVGEVLAILHTDLVHYEEAVRNVSEAYHIGTNRPEKINYIHEVIS